MAQARKILKRRKSAQNIRKITRTMEMIATARFKMIQGLAVELRPYTERMAEMVYRLTQEMGESEGHPLLVAQSQAPRQALVVIGANRGMCGGYNSALLRLARQHYEEMAARQPVDLYVVGRKAINYWNFYRVPMHWQMQQFEGRPSMRAVVDLADKLMNRFVAGELSGVSVAYTQFVSAGIQRAGVMPLLPLGSIEPVRHRQPEGRPTGALDYDFMPDNKSLLDELLPRTVRLRLYQCLLDAMVSEQMARMTAMRLATENAEDMIRRLTIQYNRLRQAAVTTELAEIISGAQALK